MIVRAAILAVAFVGGPSIAQHEGHELDHEMHAEPPVPDGPEAHRRHEGADVPEPNPVDPHAGHGSAPSQPEPPIAPAAPAASSGPVHAADGVFGPSAMSHARDILKAEHGSMAAAKLLIDRLETRARDGRDGCAWDAQFSWGGDRNKLWFKSEGEAELGRKLQDVEVQALWSRAIDPWFDVQFGMRHDFRAGADRTHAVLGVQGLAPYWFEVDTALFLSDKGDVTARAEAEYDLRITSALILQPRIEAGFSFQDVPDQGVGSGLSTASVGSRLRYEIVPQVAPYVGVEWERSFGDTRRFARTVGEGGDGWVFLFGARLWF